MGNLRYTNLPSEAAEEDALADLAMDVSCSWSGTTESIWRELNPDLWERTHNPWAVLQTVSGERLRSVTSGPEFRRTLEELGRARSGSKPPRFFGSDSCRQR